MRYIAVLLATVHVSNPAFHDYIFSRIFVVCQVQVFAPQLVTQSDAWIFVTIAVTRSLGSQVGGRRAIQSVVGNPNLGHQLRPVATIVVINPAEIVGES